MYFVIRIILSSSSDTSVHVTVTVIVKQYKIMQFQ